LRFILNLDGKAIISTADGDGTKYTRNVDMVNCVLAVMAAVGSKMQLSLFDNEWLKQYLRKLNSKQRTPHRLECNHIVGSMMDRAMLELKKIINKLR
jgi:hypothetical protein